MTATDTDVPVHYPPGKTSETRQQLAGLMCMTWAHFLNDGAAFYLPGILPAILTALHEPLAMVGIIMAAIYLGQALQPLAGIVADKIGGKLFVIGGLAACSVAGAFVGLAPNIGILLILQFGGIKRPGFTVDILDGDLCGVNETLPRHHEPHP